MGRNKLKLLSARPVDLTCWQGSVIKDSYLASDGKLLISMEYVIGPMIQIAEKLFTRRVKGQHTLQAAENLVDIMIGSNWQPALELGWAVETAALGVDKHLYDVLWIRSGARKMVPMLADYGRLLQHLIQYDEVKTTWRETDPVGFFCKGELAALCAPLRGIPERKV